MAGLHINDIDRLSPEARERIFAADREQNGRQGAFGAGIEAPESPATDGPSAMDGVVRPTRRSRGPAASRASMSPGRPRVTRETGTVGPKPGMVDQAERATAVTDPLAGQDPSPDAARAGVGSTNRGIPTELAGRRAAEYDEAATAQARSGQARASRRPMAPGMPAAPNPFLHPIQFMRTAQPHEMGQLALRTMQTQSAMRELQAPGGISKVLPFAMGIPYTRYGTLASAIDDLRQDQPEDPRRPR